MDLREIYNLNNNKLKLSFEVFPPKDSEKTSELLEELNVLRQFDPKFVSLTWGAGGNENSSLELVKNIQESGFDVMPHFTCVCSTKEFVASHIEKFEKMHIDKILALRGDIPEDKILCHREFNYASDLVGFLREKSTLSIGVAGYPEGHIESENLDSDIKNLKKKVDLGADVIFTQLFFDNDKFFKYCELVRKAGITIPIIPGIMPILSKKQIDKMTNLARISLPKKLQEYIEKYQDSNSDIQKIGVEYVSQMCENLIHNDILGLHFFTLNKSKSSKEILENIL